MAKTVQEYLCNSYHEMLTTLKYLYGPDYYRFGFKRPRIKCNDGFSISVQASSTHYCTPQITMEGPYNEVEVGYPSEAEPLLEKYADDPDDLTHTIYCWVPIEIVEEIIKKHGGMVKDQPYCMDYNE